VGMNCWRRIRSARVVVVTTMCLGSLVIGGSIAQSRPSGAHSCQWRITAIESGPVFNETQFLDPLHAYGTDGDCVWASEDGGRHWTKSHCVQSGSDKRDRIRGLQFFNWSEGWAVEGFHVLLHTTDGGRSWAPHAFDKQIIFGLRFATPERGWWVGEQPLSGVLDHRGAIYSTADGGETWDEIPAKLNSQSAWKLLQVWPSSPTDVWAVGDVVVHSLDSGKSWPQLRVRSPELDRFGNVKIQFQTPRLGWILRNPPDNYLVTEDGGKNWSPRHPPTKPPFVDDLFYLDPQEAWLAAGRVYHSLDGGVSWSVSLGSESGETEPRYGALQYLTDEYLLIATGNHNIAFCKLPGR